MSVQLYSLREAAEKDFVGVLKKVADIGYQEVQLAGLFGLSPAEFIKIIDDLGLKMTSSHTPWARSADLGEVMETASLLRLDKIVCGYGPDDFADLDAIKRSAELTNEMQAILAKNGFGLFQHNHAFEFERLGGKLKYEIYAELCPNVEFELDIFWATNFGAEDAIEMLNLFSDRTGLLHLKDGLLSKSAETGKAEMRALGSGELDIKAVVENLPEKVDSIIVELDYCNIDMTDAIELSYKYMTENGLAAGNK